MSGYHPSHKPELTQEQDGALQTLKMLRSVNSLYCEDLRVIEDAIEAAYRRPDWEWEPCTVGQAIDAPEGEAEYRVHGLSYWQAITRDVMTSKSAEKAHDFRRKVKRESEFLLIPGPDGKLTRCRVL